MMEATARRRRHPSRKRRARAETPTSQMPERDMGARIAGAVRSHHDQGVCRGCMAATRRDHAGPPIETATFGRREPRGAAMSPSSGSHGHARRGSATSSRGRCRHRDGRHNACACGRTGRCGLPVCTPAPYPVSPRICRATVHGRRDEREARRCDGDDFENRMMHVQELVRRRSDRGRVGGKYRDVRAVETS